MSAIPSSPFQNLNIVSNIEDSVYEHDHLARRETELLAHVKKVLDVYESKAGIGHYVRITGIHEGEDQLWFDLGIPTKRHEALPLFSIARPSGSFCMLKSPAGEIKTVDTFGKLESYVVGVMRCHVVFLRGYKVAEACDFEQWDLFRDRLN